MNTTVYTERLALLRREIALAGFDGFLVPRTDAYQSEYVPASDERVAFLTGFTGSSATVVVLKDKAAFFTDGRYTIQAAKQVSAKSYGIFDGAEKTPLAWLEENVGKGVRLAYDPWLHSAKNIERLKEALTKIGAEVVPVIRNFVDAVWKDRPASPSAPVFPYDENLAGKPSAEKRQELGNELKKKNVVAALIADPTSVAWLLNVRGGDIENTPVPLSRALLYANGAVEWFIDPARVDDVTRQSLGAGVDIVSPDDFAKILGRLARSDRPLLVDPAETPSWILDGVAAVNGKIERGEDPCALPRAIKTGAELNGMRAAHVRDGAALVNFFAWLDAHWDKEQLTELDVERKLAEFRQANLHYRGPSFETISGAGEHGAIVHYRATEETNAPLKSGQLFLIDSGAQYLDGTTDVTRTVALGAPTPDMRDNFTRVLKGHIALASIRFPEGTTGADLDVLARQYLWAVGRDYNHGTGHGVGCYLGVHEGPQGISKRSATPLQPGMILSNEPGYYEEGAYGIRTENLMTVIALADSASHKRKTYGFDTLTLAPIDLRLVDASMLTENERNWLNAYHRRVRKTLAPIVDDAAAEWLEAATKEIEG